MWLVERANHSPVQDTLEQSGCLSMNAHLFAPVHFI